MQQLRRRGAPTANPSAAGTLASLGIDTAGRDLRRARFHGGSIDDIDTSLFAQQASQETVVYFEQTAREFWRLSPAHREIITMIGINGMSYEQVAKVLGCPIGTVRSRLARARAELQGAIDGKDIARNRAAKRPREASRAA